jgi:hypothetical protein
MSMTLEWMIGIDDNWCSLDSLNLDSDCFGNNLSGVYVIWYGCDEAGHEGRVVCVDHGVLKMKLATLRENITLSRYSSRHLLVTWAEVDREHQASVAAYLVEELKPIIVNHRHHSVQTIVNHPPW